MDLVSICIPTYNGEKYLKECLDCVITQSHWNLEILVIDDQSSDNTVDIVREYAEHDERIKLIINEQNLGLVGNWNKCLKSASGDWIKFCFQDDYLHPDCVQEMLKFADKHEAKICITQRNFIIEADAAPNIRRFFQNDVKKMEHYVEEYKYLDAAEFTQICNTHLLDNIIGEPTVLLLHKSMIDKYGYYNEDISQMVDYEYVYRMGISEGICFMPYPFAYFRIHGSAESNKNRSSARSQEKFIKVEYVDDILLLTSQIAGIRDSVGSAAAKALINRREKTYQFFVNEQGVKSVKAALEPYYSNYLDLEKTTQLACDKYQQEYSNNIDLASIKSIENNKQVILKIATINGEAYKPEDGITIDDSIETLSVYGWAYDDLQKQPINAVYAQVNGNRVYNMLYGQKRTTHDEAMPDAIIHTAFDARIPINQVESVESIDIITIYESENNVVKQVLSIPIQSTVLA